MNTYELQHRNLNTPGLVFQWVYWTDKLARMRDKSITRDIRTNSASLTQIADVSWYPPARVQIAPTASPRPTSSSTRTGGFNAASSRTRRSRPEMIMYKDAALSPCLQCWSSETLTWKLQGWITTHLDSAWWSQSPAKKFQIFDAGKSTQLQQLPFSCLPKCRHWFICRMSTLYPVCLHIRPEECFNRWFSVLELLEGYL